MPVSCLFIAVEVKLKTSSAPCSLLPAPFQPKDYVLNYTSLAILASCQFHAYFRAGRMPTLLLFII
ncbi:hypothetical protein [Moorena sp. SIO4G3]|uniref:hypothetical protein n=1 Tax=Moorena sp. SIO4G3 TaxID=2607821 RepID=UPI00142C5393|nr:hypothetical protein [Moorena sp. SIO4G3]NEO80461.1 hypothetical protein [Moorena sp. SIO4G3]